MPTLQRVSLFGLNDAEREEISHCLRTTAARTPRYTLATFIDDCDLIVADAGHPQAVQLVVATERLSATLFVGAAAPHGAVACISRPIDIAHLLRELDFLVGLPKGLSAPRLQAVAASRWKGETDRRRLGVAAPGAPSVPSATLLADLPDLPALPAPTALLVDDSEVALRSLETRLQRWGLVMDRALNSGRAIEMLAQRNYDFVFLDLQLGTRSRSQLDGLALCHHIKRHQDVVSALTSSVFIVSAHHSEMDRVRGTLAGCDGYLDKPLDDAALNRLMLRQGLQMRAQVEQPVQVFQAVSQAVPDGVSQSQG